jgi:uncharacterized protein (TIGR02145 family)
MKRYLILLFIFCGLNSHAQDYLITFSGTGASTSVTTVKVENLTKGTSLSVEGNDILRLTSTTGINDPEDAKSFELKIYPNPVTDYATLGIFPPIAGDAIITVLDFTGKKVAQIQSYLENSLQEFHLSGLKNGFYLITVNGKNYKLSGKIISNAKSDASITINRVNVITPVVAEKKGKDFIKGVNATTDMAYAAGDRLKFTGISGNYSTVIIDIPTENKTITFNFEACIDADNNNYSIVAIGYQVWMGENLKTNRFSDGTDIPKARFADYSPGYYYYNNDEATYKTIYGALYNWIAVNSGNICPVGWHVPTDDQWTELTDYLINNGYGFEGSGSEIAKSMATTMGWTTSESPGTVGNDQTGNNSSGFTGLPGGRGDYRFAFGGEGDIGHWWTATESEQGMAKTRYLYYSNSILTAGNSPQLSLYSVRCIKD